MTNLTCHALPIGDLFGLDRIIEIGTVERISISRLDNDVQALYVFKCDNLLPKGQRLAIDDRRGIVGVYQGNTILKETQWDAVEIYVLTALALSMPYAVELSQIQELYKLSRMNEEDLETTTILNDECAMELVQDLVAICNEKLRPLSIAITLNNTACQLIEIKK